MRRDKKNQFAEACVCFSAMTTCLRKAQIIKKRNDELKIRSRLLLAFQGWTFYETGSFFCFLRHVWFVQELAKYINTNAKTSAFYYISGPPYHDGSSIIELRKNIRVTLVVFRHQRETNLLQLGWKLQNVIGTRTCNFYFSVKEKKDAKSRKEKNASQCTFFCTRLYLSGSKLTMRV